MKNIINENNYRIDSIHGRFSFRKNLTLDVLRIDLLHPILSGNKWFKLKYYLMDMQQTKAKTCVSFGGAYSNHIHAMAYACEQLEIPCIGIIRGEESKKKSHTLEEAKSKGMSIIFTDRQSYKKKLLPPELNQSDYYLIPEGGYGALGKKGVEEFFFEANLKKYSHIICTIGTGTMVAGLISSALPHQNIEGISVLKNNIRLNSNILRLLGAEERKKTFSIHHQFHYGGYAKKNREVFSFMNYLYEFTGIKTDFVYSAKLFLGTIKLINQNYFPNDSSLLVIHCGGLQGNKSLTKNELSY